MIRGMVGLNERQGQAVMNYRNDLIKQGLTKDRIGVLTDRYAATQLKSRGEMIARTETMSALNEGQKASWRDARRNGLIGSDAQKQWQAVDNACDRCGSLDGRMVPIDDSFGEPDPPLHPRCRCSLALLPGKLAPRATFDKPEFSSYAEAKAVYQSLVERVNALDKTLDTVKEGSKAWDKTLAAQKSLIAEMKTAKAAQTALWDAEQSAGMPFAEMRAKLKELGVDLKLPAKMTPVFEKTVNTVTQSVISGQQRLQELGIETKAKIGFEDFGKKFPGHLGANAYVAPDGRIYFNSKNPIWQSEANVSQATAEAFKSGWVSSESSGRTFVHEVGHTLHFDAGGRKIPQMWDAGPTAYRAKEYQQIARQVSRYAATDRYEFVAETFAGMVDGKTYSKEVMDLYRELSGPSLTGEVKLGKAAKVGKTAFDAPET